MSGRNHLPPNALKLRELPRGAAPPLPHHHPINDHHPHLSRGRLHHPSTILEDRIAIQHREIQSLLLDNQRLATTHMALKQELVLAQQDIRHLSATAADVKAKCNDQVRDVYERSLKLEKEVRSIDAMSMELVQVRADVHKLAMQRQELNAELKTINKDLAEAKTEAERLPVTKVEIETVQKEIQKGRAAIECEKKNRATNFEHGQVMERNMVAMAREIEKLRAEQANVDKRARAAANPSPGYAGNYVNPEVAYGGSPYPVTYGMQKVPSGNDAGSSFVSGAMPSSSYHLNGPYDPLQPYAHE